MLLSAKQGGAVRTGIISIVVYVRSYVDVQCCVFGLFFKGFFFTTERVATGVGRCLAILQEGYDSTTSGLVDSSVGNGFRTGIVHGSGC